MANANSTEEIGSDQHDKLLNMNKNIALSSVERDLELHNLMTYLNAFQENYNKLEMTVKELEATYERKVVDNDYLAQNLQMTEDNLQLCKTLVQEVEEKSELKTDVQRLETQINQQNQERGNAIIKKLQNVLKEKVEILEMKPLARKRRELIIKNQKNKIKLAILKQNIADQKEKNCTMRNIRIKQEQIQIIKFAKMVIENKKKHELKVEKKILESYEKNKINKKIVLDAIEVPKAKIITFEDADLIRDEPMQIGTSKYQSELSEVSKRLQELTSKQNSPESTKKYNFAIPEIKSSFPGNKILNSFKNNLMFNNMKLSDSSDSSKFKSQLSEFSKRREQLAKQYNLPKKSNISLLSTPGPSTLQKNISVPSINVLTQQKRITQNLPDQSTPPIKKCKMISSQDGQPGLNLKENIINNLSQNTQKTTPQKQLNIRSHILPVNAKTNVKTVPKNLSQNSNPPLSPPKNISLSQPISNLQIIPNTAKSSQEQVELGVEVQAESETVIKSSYFPSQTDDCNLNNSASDKVSSQLIPSHYSTQDSEKFRLSSDLENQQNSGQQSDIIEEYAGEDVNMINNDFLLKNSEITEDDYGLDVNNIDLEMPDFNPYGLSPTHPDIVEDKKEENTSNENNRGFMFNFGTPQKSSSFFNMF